MNRRELMLAVISLFLCKPREQCEILPIVHLTKTPQTRIIRCDWFHASSGMRGKVLFRKRNDEDV